MDQIQELEARRQEILQELAGIRALRKGSLNEQWFPVVRDGKKTNELRGPYYVWTYKMGKKTVSERLKEEEAVALAREHAANYRRFKELCTELEGLIVELGETLSRESVARDQVKKGLNSRPRKARR